VQEISRYQETSVGSYRLIQMVGVGPLSHAHLAERQDWPERKLVVKLFDTVPLHSPEEQDQVLDEVRLLSFLEHPSILPILDDGIHKEMLYLVSPYIEAGSLRRRLTAAAGELLPLKEALALLRQVGEALHFAHTQQAVHANLKPENILVQDDGKVFLADFLLPTLARSERAARMLSTFAAFYMAPEQFHGEATPASDQYALACLTYELLTGRPPFEADDFAGLVRKHTTRQPESPAALQPRRAGHVAHAILKALSKRPEDRYPDIQAFLADLSVPPPLVSATPVPASAMPQPPAQESFAATEASESEPLAPGIDEEETLLLPAVAASASPEDDASSVNEAPALAPGASPPAVAASASPEDDASSVDEASALAAGVAPASGTDPTPAALALTSDATLAPILAKPARARKTPFFSQGELVVIGVLLCLVLLAGFSGLSFVLSSRPNHARIHTGVATATTRSLPSSTQTSAGATSTATLVGITLRPSPTPTPRPSPTPTPTPVPGKSPTATTPPAPALSCSVTYRVSAQWQGGFIGNLTVTNTGTTTLQGWTLVFSFTAGQRIWSGWNGRFTQHGAQVTVTNPSDNATLAPGSSITPGFQGIWFGSNPAPGPFTLNGVTCH
jgi:hypothetical protein